MRTKSRLGRQQPVSRQDERCMVSFTSPDPFHVHEAQIVLSRTRDRVTAISLRASNS